MSGGCEIQQIPNADTKKLAFYSVHKDMSKEEEIATVLLHKSNPALFNRWIRLNGLAFKADGQMFTRTQ